MLSRFSFISRIFKVVQAFLNRTVDSFEKPELMLDQAIRDKAKQIREAKQAIIGLMAEERRSRAMVGKERKQKLEWERRAEMALRAGKENLAVQALQRATEHEQKADAMEATWRQQRESVDELKADIRKMDDALADFRRNKDFVIAQSKAADVKKSIYEAKARIRGDSSADDLIARMRTKVERKTYEADAAREMANEFTGDSLEKEFSELGGTVASPEVNEKLAAMKAKLGQGGSAASSSA